MQWPKQHFTDDEDEKLLLSVLHGDNWSSGEQVANFERRFAAFCGCEYALVVVNCTAAIRFSLLAVGVGPGDEVVLPGLIWPSVALAVLECGAKPVAVDIDPTTYCISAGTIEASLTQRTRAIIVAHLFCSQADMPPILALAGSKGIAVIEDAAHSVGARRESRALGTYGVAGCFSFNEKKLLTCGEAGCLVTNDADLYQRAKQLRQVDPDSRSAPSRLPETCLISEFQAAVLTTQLGKLPERLRQMERNAEVLRGLLNRLEGVRVLERLPGTDLQTFYGFCFSVACVSDIGSFRRKLGEALRLPVAGAYRPLNATMAVNPSQDSRYARLGAGLVSSLPECERAHYREAVRLRHNVLLAGPGSLELIAATVGTLIVSNHTT